MVLLGLLLPVAGEPAAQSSMAPVPVITLDGPITPALANRASGAIEQAHDDGAPAVILEVETTTGTVAATDTIRKAIRESRVPVLTWLPSGTTIAGPGAVIVLAGQLTAMAPDSRIAVDGDYARTASPFDDDRPDTGRLAEITALAEQQGRPTGWVATAVADGTVFAAGDAIAAGIVDIEAATVADLLAKADGRPVELVSGTTTIATADTTVTTSDPSLTDRLWQFLTLPTVAYLLLCFGAIGLLLELSSPGLTFPGVAGLLALGAAAILLGGMPLNWTGLLLIGGGLALLIVDVFVPSLGLLTLGGLAAFVVGSYVLFDDSSAGYTVNPVAIWVVTACLVLFFVFIAGSALKSLHRRPYSGRESMVGRLGEARTPLAPEGMVFIDGELWEAHAITLHRSAAAPIIPTGAAITVTKIDGLLLEVRLATTDEIERTSHGPPAPDRRTVIPVQSGSAVE